MDTAMAQSTMGEWQYVDDIPTILEYFAPQSQDINVHAESSSSSSSSSGGASIIHYLFEAAGLNTQSYPPRDWNQLTQLITDIQSCSFDTLKKNGLLFYLLLDYHLDDTDDVDPVSIPEVRAFISDRLLPDFWRDSIYRGYWRLDKGLHAKAVDWLDDTNSSAYAQHIVKVLAAGSGSGAGASVRSRYSRDRSQLVVKYYRQCRVAPAAFDDEALTAVLLAKATIERLQGALEFARSLPDQADRLLSHLWAWLFDISDPAQAQLIKSLAWFPLTSQEIASWKQFSLGERGTRGKACSMALDTLLVRLINSGLIMDALRINALAEQRANVYAVGDAMDAAKQDDVMKRRKRQEMLRLAKNMLPEVVRSQIDQMAIGEQSAAAGADDDEAIEEDKEMQEAAPAAAAEARAAPSPIPPYPAATPTKTKALPSQSPFASAGSSRNASFARGAGGESSMGPYARLAAQLQNSKNTKQYRDAAPQPSSSSTMHMRTSSDAPLMSSEMSMDESMLLSSLLPKKNRSSSSQQQRGSTEATQGRVGDMDVDGVSTRVDVAESARSAKAPSGFEETKRRYVRKDVDDTAKASTGKTPKKSSTAATSARKAKKPSADGTSTRIRSSQTMPSIASVSQLRSVATFPGEEEEEGDANEAEDGPAEHASTRSSARRTTTRASASASKASSSQPSAQTQSQPRTRRSARAQSETVPGAFPGFESQTSQQQHNDGDDDGGDGGSDGQRAGSIDSRREDSPPEMIEVPRRRGGAPATSGRSSRTAAGTAGAAASKKTTGARTSKATSTGAKRSNSTRERVTRSMSVSSIDEEGEGDEGEGDANADADETPRAIKTRSGRIVRRRGES